MKTFLKQLVFATTVFLATSAFISCDSFASKVGNETEIIAGKNIPIIEEVKEIVYQKPIVFIAGFDKGNDTFYANARNYFIENKVKVIDGKYSLEEIIVWLNENGNQHPFSEIHIVNKSNPYKGMNLETIVRGAKINAETLRRVLTRGTLPSLKNVVNKNSKIVFHAAGLGENIELLQTLKDAFHTVENPKIIASPYHTIFGGKFSNYHLAKSYYVFYPTAHSPGKTDLSKEIKKKYPEEKEINWYDALNNEQERYVGEAYTTQFAIPIKWEFDYYNSDNKMPKFKTSEDVINWIQQKEELVLELKKYKIPIAKFRWNWSVKGTTLVVRGRTTGLCILKPLIKPYGDLKHVVPDTSNKRLYALK
jgi:hypothetical protein